MIVRIVVVTARPPPAAAALPLPVEAVPAAAWAEALHRLHYLRADPLLAQDDEVVGRRRRRHAVGMDVIDDQGIIDMRPWSW